MNGIKYYALDENEEVPYEFVVIRNVNGEPEFCASFVNTNSLAYGNGVLLKLHQRNDELRADNAKLQEQSERLFDKTLELATENSKLRELCKLCEREVDNAKLRELVRDLWKACPADGYYCIHHCEHYDKESESHCKLEDRMRELGIEVDA